MPDITKRIKTVGGKKVSIVDQESGEVFEGKQVKEEVDVWKDNGNYIKMFLPGIELINKLSSKGTALLTWILKRLSIGQTEIEIRVSVLVKEHRNLAGGRFYDGLEELLNYGYLVKKKGHKNTYFLNPNFFFNGDRKWVNNKNNNNGK